MSDSKARKSPRLRVGAVVEIPLSDGRFAYGWYVHWDKEQGPLLQVLDIFSTGEMDLAQIETARPLFRPVVTGLRAAVRTGLWTIIGFIPVSEFDYPAFVAPFVNEETGKATRWFLWDGNSYVALGYELPREYWDLERLVVWDPRGLAKRIETGENPFAVQKLL